VIDSLRMFMYKVYKRNGFNALMMVAMLENDWKIQYKYHNVSGHSQAQCKYEDEYSLCQIHSASLRNFSDVLPTYSIENELKPIKRRPID